MKIIQLTIGDITDPSALLGVGGAILLLVVVLVLRKASIPLLVR